ncbi:phosphoglycerate kinase [Flavobacteriaceae bacterium]|nr:phosphoglycerate kinase [Flavobacteriaceae bacterium]
MKTLQDFNLAGQAVLIRVDFNVPLNDQKQVTDPNRIIAAKPTIDAVIAAKGKVILMSHLGRPDGAIDPDFSLGHIKDAVADVLGVPVAFASDCVGPLAQAAVEALPEGGVLLLENLRFHAGETKGDVSFAQQLAELGDFYINDAFGTAHRAHASTTIIAQFFPGKCAFGTLLAKEIEAIEKVMRTGEKPVTAILGGSKVSSKITIIENILDKVDHLIIGGGMTYTFVQALGGQVGNSICEPDKLDMALDILAKAKAKGVQVHLPVDVVAADGFSNDANTQVVDTYQIPAGWEGLDAGPKTLELFAQVITGSKTILWNGPVGVFELPSFSKGTISIGEAVAEATRQGAFSLVGGGDSVAAVKQFGFEHQVSYVSTGGGAMLESLEGRVLPGISAIQQYSQA